MIFDRPDCLCVKYKISYEVMLTIYPKRGIIFKLRSSKTTLSPMLLVKFLILFLLNFFSNISQWF